MDKETTDIKAEKAAIKENEIDNGDVKPEIGQPVVPKSNTALFVFSIIVSVLLAGAIMIICGTVFMQDRHETWQRRPGLVVIDNEFGPRMIMRRLF